MSSSHFLSPNSGLPSYSPSPPPPSYTSALSSGEVDLSYILLPGSYRLPTGQHNTTSGNIHVTLYNQEASTNLPEYGMQSLVSGSIFFHEPAPMKHVSIRLKGKVIAVSNEIGTKKTTILDESYQIWDSESYQTNPMSFSFPFPAITTEINGTSYSLPPSFESNVSSVDTFTVQCRYSMVLSFEKKSKKPAWGSIKSIPIPVMYRPRSRPPSPIADEWHKATTIIPARSNFGLIGPVHCTLFIPIGRVFSILEPIPFRVKIYGLDTATSQPPVVSVYILRQVSVHCRSQRSYRHIVISNNNVERHGELEWDGQTMCRPDVTGGGFNVAGVSVKDFIVVAATPAAGSPLLSYKNSVPIRLTTDSWDSGDSD